MIIGKAISPFSIKRRNGTVPTDADAQAFITASGISGTNATATNQLVIDLKAANVWTKMKAVYPMVGGTATSCKWNLKDARDLDAAYRLFFSGGGTFSANGYQPNGTNAYANTFLIPSTALVGKQNNTHISYYSRTDSVSNGDMGAQFLSGDLHLIQMTIRNSVNNFYCRINDDATTVNVSNTNSTGMYIASRSSSTIINTFKNNVKTNVSQTSSGLPARSIEIGRVVVLTAFYGNHQCAFASIGDGLTDAEALAFYNAVQNFNTTLGRNV
jgi:hypothetical protein